MIEETNPDELVTVARFDNDMDAALARQCLAGAGIAAFLADQSTVATAWHLTGALGGVKLQVAARDLDEATAVLAQAQAGELEVEGEWEVDEDERESEADANATSQDEAALRILKAAVFGLLFPPLTFYAGWLLLQPMQPSGPLSGKNRRRLVVAGLLVAIALCWYLFFASVFVRNLSDPPSRTGIPYSEVEF